jgi:hypothetical protein
MKKLIFNLGFVIGVSLILCSCKATHKSFQSAPVVSRNVELDPIKADIQVDESKKLTGESAFKYFLFIKIKGDNTYADGMLYSTEFAPSSGFHQRPVYKYYSGRIAKIKACAAYNALSQGDYDLLVHPTYSVTKKSFFIGKKIIVNVSGYGAKYKNFRTEKQKTVITNQSHEYVFPDTK